MPWMSAAGLVRVNVTHRKLRSDSATNWLSSTMTIQRKRAIGSSRRTLRRSARCRRLSDCGLPTIAFETRRSHRGPSTASTPGSTTRGSSKPSGKRKSLGSSVASSNRFGPTAAMTTFEPSFSPPPE